MTTAVEAADSTEQSAEAESGGECKGVEPAIAMETSETSTMAAAAETMFEVELEAQVEEAAEEEATEVVEQIEQRG